MLAGVDEPAEHSGAVAPAARWLRLLLANQRELVERAAARFGARDLRVFGSVARGDARDDSNIDLVARFDFDQTGTDPEALAERLHKLLEAQVEVVDEAMLGERVRADVLAEAVVLERLVDAPRRAARHRPGELLLERLGRLAELASVLVAAGPEALEGPFARAAARTVVRRAGQVVGDVGRAVEQQVLPRSFAAALAGCEAIDDSETDTEVLWQLLVRLDGQLGPLVADRLAEFTPLPLREPPPRPLEE